jgi:hypothetical protein
MTQFDCSRQLICDRSSYQPMSQTIICSRDAPALEMPIPLLYVSSLRQPCSGTRMSLRWSAVSASLQVLPSLTLGGRLTRLQPGRDAGGLT